MNAVFKQLLTEAIENETFARNLTTSPDETLKPYNLTADEIAALKALRPQTLTAFRLREKTAADPKAWRKPANFRETGAAILSVILVGLMLYATVATFSQTKVVPITYNIDKNVQVVDTFDRAKGLLNIFFPLFGAVVTFWLGVTVEGRRADRNEAEAEQAKVEKKVVEVEAKEIRNAAAESLDEAEAAVLEQLRSVGSGFERGDDAARVNQATLHNALQAICSARQKLDI